MAASVRDARLAKGLTQADLAEYIGVSRPWISQFEQGKIANAGFGHILDLCRVLDITVTVSYGEDSTSAGPARDPTEMKHDGPSVVKTMSGGSADDDSDDIDSDDADELPDMHQASVSDWMNAIHALDRSRSEQFDEVLRHAAQQINDTQRINLDQMMNVTQNAQRTPFQTIKQQLDSLQRLTMIMPYLKEITGDSMTPILNNLRTSNISRLLPTSKSTEPEEPKKENESDDKAQNS
nr:helix-turn-helix transcriptional regulator [Bifidobacterium aerophilum]